jgi:hypothetical protein
LRRNFPAINGSISDFYLSEGRMPTPQELKGQGMKSPVGDGKVWEKYGRNQFGEESYYYYGFEKGECTFVVKSNTRGTNWDEKFKDNMIPIINKTMTSIEHHWILANPEYYPPPQVVTFQFDSASSPCVDLAEVMSWLRPEQLEEIRNELLQEIEEGTYDENMSVFSKPFQEKMKARKEMNGDFSAERNRDVEKAVPRD